MPKNTIDINDDIDIALTKVKLIGRKNDQPVKTNQQKIELALSIVSNFIDMSDDEYFEQVTDLKK